MLRAKPDQLVALGAYVAREWGDYGYSITQIEQLTSMVIAAQVIASDGSRFAVLADRWGNCRYVNDHQVENVTTDEAVRELGTDMHYDATDSASY